MRTPHVLLGIATDLGGLGAFIAISLFFSIVLGFAIPFALRSRSRFLSLGIECPRIAARRLSLVWRSENTLQGILSEHPTTQHLFLKYVLLQNREG